MKENLKAVPLPYVEDHTDTVRFDSLGLPTGFDEERLLVNVAGLERFRRASGIGSLAIKAGYESDRDIFTVQDVDASGRAVLGRNKLLDDRERKGTASFSGEAEEEVKRATRRNPGLQRPLQFIFSNLRTFVPSDVSVSLDLAARDEYMRARQGGVMDARNQAGYLQGALKSGLRDANRMVSVDPYLVAATGVYYGLVTEIEHWISSDNNIAHITEAELMIRPGFVIFMSALLAASARRKLPETVKMSYRELFSGIVMSARQSFFFGTTLDRYLMGSGALAAAGKLVKARK